MLFIPGGLLRDVVAKPYSAKAHLLHTVSFDSITHKESNIGYWHGLQFMDLRESIR